MNSKLKILIGKLIFSLIYIRLNSNNFFMLFKKFRKYLDIKYKFYVKNCIHHEILLIPNFKNKLFNFSFYFNIFNF